MLFSDLSIVSYSPEDVPPAAHPDHDYVQLPLPLGEQLEAAQQEIERLTRENDALRASRFGIQRFQNDAKLLTFYTGFSVSNISKCIMVSSLYRVVQKRQFGLGHFISYPMQMWHT